MRVNDRRLSEGEMKLYTSKYGITFMKIDGGRCTVDVQSITHDKTNGLIYIITAPHDLTNDTVS